MRFGEFCSRLDKYIIVGDFYEQALLDAQEITAMMKSVLHLWI